MFRAQTLVISEKIAPETVIPKNIALDPGKFDGNWIKFEDWWRHVIVSPK